jgi:hypothetical protein
MMRTILYVSALTLALSSPALAQMHGGGGGHGGVGGGHGGGGLAASHMGGSGGARMARGPGGHGHGGRGFVGGVGLSACTPMQSAAGNCGPSSSIPF